MASGRQQVGLYHVVVGRGMCPVVISLLCVSVYHHSCIVPDCIDFLEKTPFRPDQGCM